MSEPKKDTFMERYRKTGNEMLGAWERIIDKLSKIKDENEKLKAENERLKEALEEIKKGEGRYSLDQFEHCRNTVEDMKELAEQALKCPPTT